MPAAGSLSGKTKSVSHHREATNHNKKIFFLKKDPNG